MYSLNESTMTVRQIHVAIRVDGWVSGPGKVKSANEPNGPLGQSLSRFL